MLTDLRAWLNQFQTRLQETFPGRVIFLGLQGSRSRGEATPDSDIDVVTVLDRLFYLLRDIAYVRLVAT